MRMLAFLRDLLDRGAVGGFGVAESGVEGVGATLEGGFEGGDDDAAEGGEVGGGVGGRKGGRVGGFAGRGHGGWLEGC